MAMTKCAKLSELKDGSCASVTVSGKDVALFNVGGTVYACSNTCAHQGGPLAEGTIEGTTVTCPWHSWKFDVKTGDSPMNPMANIKVFKTKIEADAIWVEL